MRGGEKETGVPLPWLMWGGGGREYHDNVMVADSTDRRVADNLILSTTNTGEGVRKRPDISPMTKRMVLYTKMCRSNCMRRNIA